MDWVDSKEIIWTNKNVVMIGLVFGSALWDATSERYRKDGLGRDKSGNLCIEPLYVPAGFSGGGAYVNIPARAFNRAAANSNPGDH